MKKSILSFGALAGAIAALSFHAHAAEIGGEAPAFTLKNTSGEEVSLEDYKGKIVVLEWINYDCPFVKKHYESGNLPKLQEKYGDDQVAWLLVNSAAEGKQGYLEPEALQARADKEGAKADGILLDPDGKVGKAYGATNTPHMFVIDQEGRLVYSGAIDSINSTDKEDIAKAENYVVKAVDAVLAGEEVETPKTQAYGCNVKY